jgi:hypothetical protein
MRQRGILLLPVALTLAVIGALAYTMTREGSMSASAVDAEYDTDVARYLAEAGVNLSKWQNEKRGCFSSVGFRQAVALPGGAITASDRDIVSTGKGLTTRVTATSERGAVSVLSRDWLVHDLSSKRTVSVAGGSDTFIREGSGVQSPSTYLETTDGKAHGLIQFGSSSALKDAMIVKAELRLWQSSAKSSQPIALGIHRITSPWAADKATWTAPWSGSPGGEYASDPAATAVIAETQKLYTWRIDALVEGWVQQRAPNYGILLKPNGLLEARFASFEADSNRPELVVDYYPSCR